MVVEIKDLLARFGNLLLQGEGRVQFIQEAIREATGLKVESKDIKVVGGTIYLNIKPIYKNEIFLKQEKIFSELQRLLGQKAPKNMR